MVSVISTLSQRYEYNDLITFNEYIKPLFTTFWISHTFVGFYPRNPKWFKIYETRRHCACPWYVMLMSLSDDVREKWQTTLWQVLEQISRNSWWLQFILPHWASVADHIFVWKNWIFSESYWIIPNMTIVVLEALYWKGLRITFVTHIIISKRWSKIFQESY